MTDKRVAAALKAYTQSQQQGYRDGRDNREQMHDLVMESFSKALEAADAADTDHVRVPRETMRDLIAALRGAGEHYWADEMKRIRGDRG